PSAWLRISALTWSAVAMASLVVPQLTAPYRQLCVESASAGPLRSEEAAKNGPSPGLQWRVAVRNSPRHELTARSLAGGASGSSGCEERDLGGAARCNAATKSLVVVGSGHGSAPHSRSPSRPALGA